MASRRSRLKAVANLPIRRKPLSIQQEIECSKVQSENFSEPLLETGEKEEDTKGCEETSNSEKADCCESVENVISSVCESANGKLVPDVQEEVEKFINVEVPSNEDMCKPNPVNKSLLNPASRFGRRVKPCVSLSVLKDRTLKAETNAETSLKECEVLAVREIQLDSLDNTCCSVNDLSEDATTQPIRDEVTLWKEEAILNEISGKVENIPSGNKIPEKLENEQCHINTLNDLSQKNPERTLQLNLKSLVNSTKQSMNLNGLHSNCSNTTDSALRQRNDILSQSNRTFSEHSPNHTSQSSFHLQFSSMGIRRNNSCIKQKKPKFNDFARKVADARREFQRKYEKIPPDRSSLRMIDLIFYNPSTNPMESKAKFEKKELTLSDQELINESRVDDPDPVDKNSDLGPDDERRTDDFGKMPVPQVKIGSNGEIILDEKSLIIETTDAKKGREDLQNSVPVFEDKGSRTCYYKRKTQKSRDWSDLETKRFYKALNTIGTDFSLMQKYFPVRTRLELKNKFKREEKLNRSLIDKALNNPSEFDITQFEKYLATEKQLQEEENERRLQRKIKPKRLENKVRTKSSLLAREINESDEEVTESYNSLQVDQAKMKMNDRSKKANEINLLSEKYSLRGSDTNQDSCNQQCSQVINVVQANGLNSVSKVFTNTSITEANNASKIRDAFDEIRNVNNSEKRTDGNIENGNVTVCYDAVIPKGGAVDVVDEFYQAVVSLSSSMKFDDGKNQRAINKSGKKAKLSTKGEKRKATAHLGKKQGAKKPRERVYASTLDIETYDSKCDSNSSSNESNDNSVMSTKTITDQDFMKLLAANAENLKESKIQFQITESCSLEKNVEIILDNVPSITLSEI